MSERGVALRTLIGASAAVVVSGVLASNGVIWGEVGTTEALNALPRLVIDAFEVVMQLGTRGSIVLVAVVAAVLIPGRWERVVVAVVFAGVLAWMVSDLGKKIVERPRPAGYSTEVTEYDPVDGFGWPSTHVSIAAGSLTAAALIGRRRAAPAVAAGAVVGVARMAVGVHLPLDVIGGLGIGVVSAVVMVSMVERVSVLR